MNLYAIKRPDGTFFLEPDDCPYIFPCKYEALAFIDALGFFDEPGWTFPAVKIVEVPDGKQTA